MPARHPLSSPAGRGGRAQRLLWMAQHGCLTIQIPHGPVLSEKLMLLAFFFFLILLICCNV